MCERVENPGQSIIFISYDYSYFILFYSISFAFNWTMNNK